MYFYLMNSHEPLLNPKLLFNPQLKKKSYTFIFLFSHSFISFIWSIIIVNTFIYIS